MNKFQILKEEIIKEKEGRDIRYRLKQRQINKKKINIITAQRNIINKVNTKSTPRVLLGNDLKQLQNNKQYHSGRILFGVINGLAII